VSGQLHALAALSLGERVHGSQWTGGWLGPRASLDAVEKTSQPPPGIKSLHHHHPITTPRYPSSPHTQLVVAIVNKIVNTHGRDPKVIFP